MASVGNMISANCVSSNNSATKNQISELRKKMNDLSKDSALTSEQRQAKQKEYSAQMDALNTQYSNEQNSRLASMQDNMSGLLSGFGSGTNSDSATGFDFFFGANSSMSSLKVMNTARVGIENRARSLMSEIKMDQMRGVNTDSKKEMLSNLTANLNIMDGNLNSNINKTLTPSEQKASKPAIIDQINSDLKAMQKKEEKSVQEKYGQKEEEIEETEETEESGETTE